MFNSSREEAKIITLPKLLDPRGNLTFVEGNKHIPFNPKRVYWIYDVPGGEVRGGHAFKAQRELIVALSGSFDVVLHDGNGETKYQLNRSYYGLYVPAMHWRHIENFSTNSVAMVLTDKSYTVDEYIRSFEDFKTFSIKQ
jgi:dTDP-4-dehydrorhamnose 3,5-epimerase-like enzyme